MDRARPGDPWRPPRLVALTPGELRSGPEGAGPRAALVGQARALARDGLPGLLLREPALLDGEFLALARELRAALDDAAAEAGRPRPWLALHDRAHLVGAVGADGLHLGWRSLPPGPARRVLDAGARLGLSTHAPDPPPPAEVDWVSYGPLAPTPSKQGLVEPVGLDGLARRVARGGPPVLALGGLTPALAGECLAAGAAGVLVRGALLGAPDPRRALAEFARSLTLEDR